MSHGGIGEWGEVKGGTCSKLKTDWKINPCPKPGRRRDECKSGGGLTTNRVKSTPESVTTANGFM